VITNHTNRSSGKKYLTLRESAEYLNEKLNQKFSENHVLYYGEQGELSISIRCYYKKVGTVMEAQEYVSDKNFYFAKNLPKKSSSLKADALFYSGLRTSKELLENKEVVRGNIQNSSDKEHILRLAKECAPNLKNLRENQSVKGFESLNRSELCVDKRELDRYIKSRTIKPEVVNNSILLVKAIKEMEIDPLNIDLTRISRREIFDKFKELKEKTTGRFNSEMHNF